MVPVSNLFSVVIMQAMLGDLLSRKQVTWLCPDTSVEKENSVWTPGLSTNKCDVYFLNVICYLFQRRNVYDHIRGMHVVFIFLFSTFLFVIDLHWHVHQPH